MDMFFGYNFPKPEPTCMWMKSGILVMGHGAHSHKKNGGNHPRGSAPGCQNVLFFCYQGNAAFRPLFLELISTIFETTDVNRFPHVYTGEKFSNFCAGGFPDPQNSPKYSTLG